MKNKHLISLIGLLIYCTFLSIAAIYHLSVPNQNVTLVVPIFISFSGICGYLLCYIIYNK